MQLTVLFCALIATACWAVFSFNSRYRAQPTRRHKNLQPPGPALVPWIGRVHDLPIQRMWLKFEEWAHQYGPIYRTQMLGTNFIIVSDEEMAEDLLVKRANIYSDRPAFASLVDSKSTHGSMEYLPLMGRNKYWARQRKLVHAYLTEASNMQYRGVLAHETRRFLMRLVTDPDNFCSHLEDTCSKIVCQLAWDDPSASEDLTKTAYALLTQISPAGPLTNVLTPLWHLPMAINPWKSAEYKRHAEQQHWWMNQLLSVKQQVGQNTARPSFAKACVGGMGDGVLSGDYETSSMLGMMATVAVFTIAGPLYYFLLAMLHHPQWQEKCQIEIDQVCQNGRMPQLKDSPRLPILRACIKETMRWRPNVPTGVAHEVEEDDIYEGYLIPKGSRILPLDCAFLRNPVKYPDPQNFRPERWLEPGWPTFQEPLSHFPTILGLTSFGWGRRTCLGQTLTRDETLSICGALIWAFNLLKANGPDGEPIDPPLDDSTSLLIIKPNPFKMKFQPRSENRKAQILENWKESEAADHAARAACTHSLADRER